MGWGQIAQYCVPEARYFVDIYAVAYLRHAWDGPIYPTLHTVGVQGGVNRIVCLWHTQAFVNQYMVYNVDVILLTDDLIPFVGHR